MEDIKKILESKTAVNILYGIGIIIVAMIIFYAGITVGFHKASYGQAWADHYNENFGMGHSPMGTMPMRLDSGGDYFPNAHGATGKIIKIELPNVMVQDKENTEKVITINPDTTIQKDRVNITAADLHVDDFVVTIGAPNDTGVIEAKFIRVIPSPEFLTQ